MSGRKLSCDTCGLPMKRVGRACYICEHGCWMCGDCGFMGRKDQRCGCSLCALCGSTVLEGERCRCKPCPDCGAYISEGGLHCSDLEAVQLDDSDIPF